MSQTEMLKSRLLVETKRFCAMLEDAGNFVEGIDTYLLTPMECVSHNKGNQKDETIIQQVDKLLDLVHISDLLEMTLMILLAENKLSPIDCATLQLLIKDSEWLGEAYIGKESLNILSCAYENKFIED